MSKKKEFTLSDSLDTEGMELINGISQVFERAAKLNNVDITFTILRSFDRKQDLAKKSQQRVGFEFNFVTGPMKDLVKHWLANDIDFNPAELANVLVSKCTNEKQLFGLMLVLPQIAIYNRYRQKGTYVGVMLGHTAQEILKEEISKL